MTESESEFLNRKIKEITETIEIAKNGRCILSWETKDTSLMLPQGNTPVIVVTVIIAEIPFHAMEKAK